MTLKFILFEKDYMENQLYYSSQSSFIKKSRRNTMLSSIVLVVVIFLVFVLLNLSLLFPTLFAVIYIAILPFSIKSRLENSFRKAVVELFKNRFGEATCLEFKASSVIDSSQMRQSEIFYLALQSIEETGDYFFILLKYGEQLIIPKSEVPKDAVKTYLQTLAQQLNIPYNSNLNWKWK